MRQRPLGRTGQLVSEIGFGCGSVGGLFVRGEAREQTRALERALELGVSYFDTAAAYGEGRSEENLGRALAELRPEGALIGTKLRIMPSDLAAGAVRIGQLLDESLRRLGRDSVDVLYLHSRIRVDGDSDRSGLSVTDVLGPVLQAFRGFQGAHRVRFIGFTGLGDTPAVLEVVDEGAFDLMQCYFNAVNPTAGYVGPAVSAAQDLGRMIDRAREAGMGVVAIRILAAGALAGDAARHPVAGGPGVLLGGTDYETDRSLARRLQPIAGDLGVGLAELAIRFALSKEGVSTALVGVSEVGQIELAARAADRGALPPQVVQAVLAALAAGPSAQPGAQ